MIHLNIFDRSTAIYNLPFELSEGLENGGVEGMSAHGVWCWFAVNSLVVCYFCKGGGRDV